MSFIYLLLCTFLLTCGDVHPNPGPIYSQSHGHGLSIFSTNIRSLKNKMHYLRANIPDNTDLIAIQETWFDDSISKDDESISIAGFGSPVRRDRNRDGGGVAIYISNNLGLIKPPLPVVNDIEYVCIDVQTGSKKYRILNVYRPESPVIWYDHFRDLLEITTNVRYDFYCVGDLNLDYLVPNEVKKLERILHSFNLRQHIDQPTRITENSKSAIDLFITRDTNVSKLNLLNVIPPFASDHHSVHAVIGKPLKEAAILTRPNGQYPAENRVDILNGR